MAKNLEAMKQKIANLLKKKDIARAGIFGSYARGEQNKNSDIDIVIEFKGKKSLLDLIALELALKKALKRKVDISTYKSISPHLKKQILAEEIKIL